MNEIGNKLLLAGDKFMPEMHLKQPGFTYSACGSFTKNKERIEKYANGNTDFIYRNELDKACFQHDVAYGKTNDLAKRTQSDKILRDKTFQIARDPKYDGSQRVLASTVYNFFLIRNLAEVVLLMNQIISWQMKFINQLLKNLRKKRLFII